MAGVAAVGLAAGAALAVGLSTAFERERLGDQLAAQLGLSEQESARLGGIAGNLYAEAYGESFGQVNDAVGAVVSTLGDLGDADVESLSAKALDLASAFGLDVSQAVTTAGTLLRNDLVDDADEAFDLITVGLQSVPAQMRDEIFPVMEEYGGFFSALGLSGDEAMALIVTASDGGVLAMDKVGDALKELTIRGTDMSAASVEAYEAAGLSAEEMSAALLAGGDTAADAFDDIVGGLLSISDPTEQAAAAIALFGTPLEDLGTSDIPSFLKGLTGVEGGLGDITGAAEAMGDTLNDNTATTIEAFRRQLMDGLVNALVTHVIPAFQALQVWWTENGPAISAAAAILAEGLRAAFEVVSTAVGTVAGWIQTAFGEGGEGSTALAAFAERATEWGAQLFAIFQEAFALLQGAIEFFTGIAVGLWEAFGGTITAAASTVWGAIEATVDSTLSIIQGLLQTFTGIFTGDWDKFSGGIAKIWEGLWGAVKAAFDLGWGLVKAAVDAVLIVFKGAWTTFTGDLEEIWDSLWSGLAQAWDSVWGAVTSAVDSTIGEGSPIREAWNGLTEFFGDAWDSAFEVIETAMGVGGTIRNAITGAVQGLIDAVRPIWDGVRNVLAAPINWVAQNVINGLIGAVNQVSSALGAGNLLDRLPNPLIPTFHEGGIVGEDGRLTSGMPGPGERLIKVRDGEEVLTADDPRHRNRMGNNSTLFLESDVAPIGGPFDWIGDVAASAANAARNLITDVARPIISSLMGPIESMAGQFGAPGRMVAGAGRKLVDSALAWLSGAENALPAGQLQGTGWQALVNFMRDSGVPHVVTSTYRAGDPGAHGSGRAADFSIGGHGNRGYGSPGLRAIWEALSGPAAAGQISQMILAGAPQQYRNFPSTWKTPGAPGNHWNHVHAATFDSGGWLKPGWNTLENATGGPEHLVPAGSPGDVDWDAMARDFGRHAAREFAKHTKQYQRAG